MNALPIKFVAMLATVVLCASAGVSQAQTPRSNGTVLLETFTGNLFDAAESQFVFGGTDIGFGTDNALWTNVQNPVPGASDGGYKAYFGIGNSPIGVTGNAEYVWEGSFNIGSLDELDVGDPTGPLFRSYLVQVYDDELNFAPGDIQLMAINTPTGGGATGWDIRVHDATSPAGDPDDSGTDLGLTLNFSQNYTVRYHHKGNVAGDIDVWIDNTMVGSFTDRNIGLDPARWSAGNNSTDPGFDATTMDNVSIGGVTFAAPGEWGVDNLGDWNFAANWGDSMVPNAVDAPARFLGIISANRTISTDADVTVGTLQFDNANSYVIAGSGTLSLDVAAGNATIDVDSGDHQFQAVVSLNDDTDADVAASSSISFNNALNLNGNNLNTTGAGTVNINNQLNTGGGQVNVPAGVLGGSGEVGGNLNVTGGTVAPGNSAGTLSVEGNATFDGSSTLDVEIESLGSFDVLAVTGNAVLDGTLNISLLGGYTPTNGDMFTILTGASVTDNGLTLSGASGFSLANSGTALTLTFGGVTLLLGDANNSGTVTADDLIAVQQNFGNVGPNGDGTDLGDANDDGAVTADDLISVQQNFGDTLGAAAGGSAVPEPASLALIALGAIAVASRRR